MNLAEEILRDLEPYQGVLEDKCNFFYEKSGFKEQKCNHIATLRLNSKQISESNYVTKLLNNDDFKQVMMSDPFEGLRIFWKEILERVHALNLVSMQRNQRWFEGVLLGVQHENLFVFAAAYRGLIESISDALDALKYVTKRLDEKEKIITSILEGELEAIKSSEHLASLIDKDLEEALIHFVAARDTWGEKDTPAAHKKKTFREYAESFDANYSESARKAWRDLCQLTHPSHSSISPFYLPHDKIGETWKVGLDADFLQILVFTYKHKNVLPNMCNEYLANVFYSASILKRYKYSNEFKPELKVVMNEASSTHG